MPNVPTIPIDQVQGTEALPTPYQSPRTAAGAGAQAIGEGLARLSAGLERVQVEADNAAAQEAEATYAREILEAVYGPEGFRQKKGHDALAGSVQLTKTLEERRKELAKELRNDRQRQVFLARTEAEYLGALRSVEIHAGEEADTVARDAFTARMSAAGGSALAVYRDPDERERQIANAYGIVEREAERLGLDEASGRAMVDKWQRAIVQDVLDRLLADPGRGSDAEAFFKAHERDLGPLASRYAGAVQKAVADDAPRREEARIWEVAGQDPVQALELVRGLQDATLADEVGKRLVHRFNEDAAARKASDSTPEARLEVALYQGRGLDRRSLDYQTLSEEGKARIEQKAESAARSDRSEQRALDQELLYTFRGLPLSGYEGRDRISVNVDQEPLFAMGSPAVRARIKAEQRVARDTYDKDAGATEGDFEHRAAALADSLGYRARRRARFLNAVRADRTAWVMGNPEAKTLPAEVVNRIFADAVTKGEVAGVVFDDTKYAWEAKLAGELEKFTRGPDQDQPGLSALERLATERAPPAAPRTPGLGKARPPAAPPMARSHGEPPAAPKVVHLVGPGGKRGSAPPGPELSAWLKAHPDWRIE